MVKESLVEHVSRRSLLMASVGIALLSFPTLAQGEVYEVGPRSFIKELTDESLSILNSKKLSKVEQEARFRQLYVRYFDDLLIARTIIGPPWREMSPPEKVEINGLVNEYVVKSLMAYLHRFRQAVIQIPYFVKDGSEYAVDCRAEIPSKNRYLNLLWLLRENGKSYKIHDVKVEGHSMMQHEQRDLRSKLTVRFLEKFRNAAEAVAKILGDKIVELNTLILKG